MEEGSFAFCVLAFTFSGKSVYSVLLLVRLSARLPSLSPSLPPAYTEDQQQLSQSPTSLTAAPDMGGIWSWEVNSFCILVLCVRR